MEIWRVYVINKQEEAKGVIFPHGGNVWVFLFIFYFFGVSWSLPQDMKDHLRNLIKSDPTLEKILYELFKVFKSFILFNVTIQ